MHATALSVTMRPRGMSRDRVDWHMWNWERLMRRREDQYRPATDDFEGYQSRADSGIWATSSREFDAMVAEADRRCAEAVNALVDDLPSALHMAVYQTHRLVSSVGRFRQPVVNLYDQALGIVGKGLTIKGIE